VVPLPVRLSSKPHALDDGPTFSTHAAKILATESSRSRPSQLTGGDLKPVEHDDFKDFEALKQEPARARPKRYLEDAQRRGWEPRAERVQKVIAPDRSPKSLHISFVRQDFAVFRSVLTCKALARGNQFLA